MGYNDDWLMKGYANRVESFEIAADEQLIGATVYSADYGECKDWFAGVEWMKWKIRK